MAAALVGPVKSNSKLPQNFDRETAFSLDELLEIIIDLMPVEIELCSKILQSLRVAGRCFKIHLEREMGDIQKAVAEFIESRRDNEEPLAVSNRPGFIRMQQLLRMPALHASYQNGQRLPNNDSVDSGRVGRKKQGAGNKIRAKVHDNITRLTSKARRTKTRPECDGHATDRSASSSDSFIGGSPVERINTAGQDTAKVSTRASFSTTPTEISDMSSNRFRRYGFTDLPWLPAKSHGPLLQRIFLTLDDPTLSIAGKVIAVIVVLTVIVSTISFILESIPEFNDHPNECAVRRAAQRPLSIDACEPQPLAIFYVVEVVCIVVFTFEYCLRVGLAHTNAGTESGWYHTLKYAKVPINIIDLLAIVPFYVELTMGKASGDALALVRVLRLARVLRLLKMGRHNRGMRMFTEVMIMSWQMLALVFFFNAIVVVIFGSLIYFAENQRFSIAPEFTMPTIDACRNQTVPAQFPYGVYVRKDKLMEKDEVNPFRSISVGLWWVCVTMTTVGYGDMAPATPLGKTFGILTFYVGILLLALPIGVLSTNFETVYKKFNPPHADQIAEFKQKMSVRGESRTKAHGTIVPDWRHLGFRRASFLALEDPMSCQLARYWSILMTGTIVASTVSFVLESSPEFQYRPGACTMANLSVNDCTPKPEHVFHAIEAVCMAIFTFDYVMRIGLVHSSNPCECGLPPDISMSPAQITWKYCKMWLNVIDFLAVVPFYFDLIVGTGVTVSVLRVLRLVRVFRLLKGPKLRSCADMLINIIIDSLPALVSLMFVSTLMCCFVAACIQYAEGSAYSVDAEVLLKHPKGAYMRPTVDGFGEEQTPFKSIPYAFWWFFVTATTVGYGDDYPTTTLGRAIAIVTVYLGIVLIAMPLSIVGGSFNKFYPHWVEEFGHHCEKVEGMPGEKVIETSAPAQILSAPVVAEKIAQVPIPPAPAVAEAIRSAPVIPATVVKASSGSDVIGCTDVADDYGSTCGGHCCADAHRCPLTTMAEPVAAFAPMPATTLAAPMTTIEAPALGTNYGVLPSNL